MNLEEIKDLALEDLANDTQLEMVAIPGGTFIMGSPENEEGSNDDERPQHEVTIEPFFMGKYQVTQAQWRFVAQLAQVNRELEQDPSNFKVIIALLSKCLGMMQWSFAIASQIILKNNIASPVKLNGNILVEPELLPRFIVGKQFLQI